MVNVTKENFIEQSNDLLKHLPSAAFVALDEEMTGIQIPSEGGRPTKDLSPSRQWPTLRQPPERYAIIQLGLSLFHHDNKSDRWSVRRYNFYMFPASNDYQNRAHGSTVREVVLNPSAVAFLNQHNMSFDVWSKQGVPYCTASEAQELVDHYVAQQLKERQADAPKTPARQGDRVQLRRRDDIEFYSRAMASLREWLDLPQRDARHRNNSVPVEEGIAFLMPACNRFLRRALYETIEQEYPSLVCDKATGNNNQIRVLRLTDAEKQARTRRLQRAAFEDLLVGKVGMYRIFDALSRVCRGRDLVETDRASFSSSMITMAASAGEIDWNKVEELYNGSKFSATDSSDPTLGSGRKIPLVVHNGLMDILFLFTHFYSHKLPDRLQDAKTLIRQHFPIIYDTKLVSTECDTPWNNEYSNLANLYKKIVTENTALANRIEVVEAVGDRDAAPDQEHEAAYDAYMTGSVFIGLCEHIQQKQSADDGATSSDFCAICKDGGELIICDGCSGSFHPECLNVRLEELPEGAWYCDSCAFVKLIPDGESETAKANYGRNKLYQMSMYTLELEDAKDPLTRGMHPSFAYRVSEADPSVTTRDIIRCLSGMMDNMGRSVHFEIVWVDDTTFVVAACYKAEEHQNVQEAAEEGEVVSASRNDEDLLEILQDRGPRIQEALGRRFAAASIITLEEHLSLIDSMDEDSEREEKSWFSRFKSLLGFGAVSSKKRKSEEPESNQAAKRRRT